MNAEEQLREVLTKLLERSRKNEVNWLSGRDPEYFVKFPDNSRIVLIYASPESAPDWVAASLVVNGVEVANLFAEDGDDAKKETFTLMRQLWQDAHRSVTGWDTAINQIKSSVESDPRVGIAPHKVSG